MQKAIFGFLAFLSMVAASCREKSAGDQQVFTVDDVAVEIARNVEILYSDSAIVRVRVSGPVLHNFTDIERPRQEFPGGVKIDFLEPDQSIRTTIVSKMAIREQNKGLITVRDSVVLTTVKQEKLDTEELIWDEKTAKIRTDKFVKVTQPGEIIYGFGLEAEQDFSYWKIKVPKGRIKSEKFD
ncbi:MAG: LPS export ABC transporter periplasmic protein LptC [Saprospiraceae bacterium]|nr:LPS export ABC transporter periplasmic protein LptC [Saprospiraceae bacterium]